MADLWRQWRTAARQLVPVALQLSLHGVVPGGGYAWEEQASHTRRSILRIKPGSARHDNAPIRMHCPMARGAESRRGGSATPCIQWDRGAAWTSQSSES